MQDAYTNTPNLTFGKWLISSTLYFFICILSLTILMMIANVGLANNLHFPILDTLSLFAAMYEQNAWETLYIFSNKSLFAIGEFDNRSGLYLWTLELDFITLLTYALACGIAKFVFHQAAISTTGYTSSPAYKWSLVGLIILILSKTYITVLGHCAGPTWIGYVALYGLGVEELELTPLWQWLSATFGLLLILNSSRKAVSNSRSDIF